MTTLTQELHEKMRRETLDDAGDEREAQQGEMRARLREFAVQLREPHGHGDYRPASTSTPSFKLGDVKEFPFVSERGETKPGQGNLSDTAYKDFMANMKDAAARPDTVSRDAATGRAAKVVADDWLHKHGHKGLHDPKTTKEQLLHDARAQVTFASREIGQKLGMGPVESTAIGYSLERSLEKEGFRVLASHAMDKGMDVFKASATAVAGALGTRANMEAQLASSMTWLAEHGVTREVLKDAVLKHSGKFQVLMEAATHPDALRRSAQLISHSDSVFHAVTSMATDKELRQAVGSLTLSAGEGLASVPGSKAIASTAIVAGSLMRGDSAEDTGRHAFRAALAILGGAAGGITAGGASGGTLAVAGAMGGSFLGEKLADKLIDVYDNMTGSHAKQAAGQHTVSKDELGKDASVLADRVGHSKEVSAIAHKAGELVREKGPELEREMGFGKS